MKNFKILSIFVLAVLVFGLSQSMPHVFAAQSDIGTIKETLTLDGTAATTTPEILQVSGDTFVVVWSDSDGDGQIATFTVGTDGDISDAVVDGPDEFNTDATDPEIIHISGDVYAVVYRSGTAIVSDTYTISSTGTISAVIADNTSLVTTGDVPDLVHVTSNSDRQVYAIAYEDGTAVDVATISFPNDGSTPSAIDSNNTIQTTSENPAIIKVTTGVYAVAYVSTADDTADVETFAITNTGTVGATVDTFDLHGGANAVDGDTHPAIAHVKDNIYVVVYSDGDDLHVETFDIDSTGQIGSQQALADVEINSADTAREPAILQTDVGVNPINFIVAYYDSASDAGELVSVTITPDGGTITGQGGDSNERLTYDSAGGESPSLAHRGPTNAVTGQTNYYLVAHQGSAVVSSFNLGDKNDSTAPTLLSVALSNNNGLNTNRVNTGDVVTVTFEASEEISTPDVRFGAATTASTTETNTGGNVWTATYTVQAGDDAAGGTALAFQIDFSDASPQANAGTQVTAVTDNTAHTVDNTAPTSVNNAKILGTQTISVPFSEAVITADGDYSDIDLGSNEGDNRGDDAVSGNGTSTAIVTFSGAAIANTDTGGTLDVAATVTDLAGNALGALDEKVIDSAATSTVTEKVLTSTNSTFFLDDDTFTTTITASTLTSVSLNMTSLDSPAGFHAEFPTGQTTTVTTSNAQVLFAADTRVSNMPPSETLTVAPSTKSASGITGTVGTIIEFGDANRDIVFNTPVRVVLTGQTGETAFIINAAGVTEIVSACSGNHTTAAEADDVDIVANDDECFFVSGGSTTFWTRHFSGFGISAGASATGGGGPSGPHGDSTPPSLFGNFDAGEYPIEFDGVKYSTSNLDSFHTAVVKTGQEFTATIRAFDNSGPSNIRHAELYVNQPIDRILNDLSETIIVYDESTGVEIVDPHNLIASATVTPSTAGNKAEFNFSVVFENTFEPSGMIFRMWDLQRNPLEIYLPNSLTVVPGNVATPSDEVLSISPGLVGDQPADEQTASPEPLATVLEESIPVVNDKIADLVTEQLANELAIDVSAVENILGGFQEPSDEFLATFAEITDIVVAKPESLDAVLEKSVAPAQVESVKEQLANELIIDVQVVQEILTGTQEPSDEFLKVFSDITGVDAQKPESMETIFTNAVSSLNQEKIVEIVKEQIAQDLAIDVEAVDDVLTGEQEASAEFVESFEEMTGIITDHPVKSTVKDIPHKYSETQMAVLQQWGGYDVQSATDKDVLREFNISGESIPSWFKNTVKWFVDGFVDKQTFVTALKNLESRGFLGESAVDETSYEITASADLEQLLNNGKVKLEFAENSNIIENVNISSLEDKILTIHAISNNAQIREILVQSNEEFAGQADLGILISERNTIWMESLDEPTSFMDDTLTNRGALIAKALVETQKDESIPILRLTITNAYGVNAILSEMVNEYVNTDAKWWQKGLSDDLYVTIGNANDSFTGQYLGEITLPIYDIDGTFIGMLNAQVDLQNTLLGQ